MTVPEEYLCPWDSPGKNTGVGCHALLQGIFPTQGSNPGLLHCRQILYHLSLQGSPSPLHTHLQVANCQRRERVFACSIMYVRSPVWQTLSHACILCNWLCLCVLRCAVQQWNDDWIESRATQTSPDRLFKGVDRIEFSQEPEPVPSMSGMSDIAPCSPSLTILQLYHLLPLASPPGRNSSCLCTWCQPLYASCCPGLLDSSRCWTVRLKISSLLFSGCLFFMYDLGENYINLLEYSTVQTIVLLGFLSLFFWAYECALGVELICMEGTYRTCLLPLCLFSLQLALVHLAAPYIFLVVLKNTSAGQQLRTSFSLFLFFPH